MTTTKTHTFVSDRVAAYTTEDNRWSFWPDKAEIVKIESVDASDPKAMYDFAYALGTADATRRVRSDGLPHNIRIHLPEPSYGNVFDAATLVSIHFALAGARGQEDDANRRNLLALFPPHSKWNSPLGKTIFCSSHALRVEIGCIHEYSDSGSNHRRGYHRGQCKRCSHKWMCDSGD